VWKTPQTCGRVRCRRLACYYIRILIMLCYYSVVGTSDVWTSKLPILYLSLSLYRAVSIEKESVLRLEDECAADTLSVSLYVQSCLYRETERPQTCGRVRCRYSICLSMYTKLSLSIYKATSDLRTSALPTSSIDRMPRSRFSDSGSLCTTLTPCAKRRAMSCCTVLAGVAAPVARAVLCPLVASVFVLLY
jgi:hypothetical protein